MESIAWMDMDRADSDLLRVLRRTLAVGHDLGSGRYLERRVGILRDSTTRGGPLSFR